jgi:RNA polymerase sigma factor (sigma-70 family)
MLKPRTRPARGEIDEAALGLARRHGAQILATARRYAATPEDAEDAYQRGLEILLTKAPTTREEELVPWLKTVVKHEAFALRRQRERHTPVSDDGELVERATAEAITHDPAAQHERLRQGAEALGQLKPQEMRALVLRAEGYSYREICEISLDLHQGQPLFDRRVARVGSAAGGNRGRDRHRQAGPAAVGVGRRRGGRPGGGAAPAAPEELPQLPRAAQVAASGRRAFLRRDGLCELTLGPRSPTWLRAPRGPDAGRGRPVLRPRTSRTREPATLSQGV